MGKLKGEEEEDSVLASKLQGERGELSEKIERVLKNEKKRVTRGGRSDEEKQSARAQLDHDLRYIKENARPGPGGGGD